MGSICGLASLPPELLSLVFSFVICGIPASKESRSITSARLSQVCRHFRDVVTGTPQFWNEIRTTPYAPEMGLVSRSLERSKNHPLDIYLNLYTSCVEIDEAPSYQRNVMCDEVFSAITPHISRWRRLHLNFIKSNRFVGSSTFIGSIPNASFPILESLTDNHWNSDRFSDRQMLYSVTWNTPFLRTLDLYDCIPQSLVSLATITTFKITLSNSSLLVDMLKSLSKTMSLRDVYIDILNMTDLQEELIPPTLDNIVLGSVTRFTLCYALPPAAGDNDGFQPLHAMLSKLFFPNATSVVLNGSRTNFGTSDSQRFLHLHRLLRWLSEQNRFPKAVNCEVIVWGDGLDETILPGNLPVVLENLTFTCNTLLSFPESEAWTTSPVSPKLRTLTLKLEVDPPTRRRYYFQVGKSAATCWVQWLVQVLRAHGGWDTFETLFVQKLSESYGEDDNECERAFPRDKVDAWCKTGKVFPRTLRYLQNKECRIRDEYDSWD